MPEKENKIKKKNFRCKAHVSSFKTDGLCVPKSPLNVKWGDFFEDGKMPVNIDIGCGYGRFLFNASEKIKGNILGIEMRKPVCNYVSLKLEKMKNENKTHRNVSVVNSNAMLFLPNFFTKASLENIFILFPDPHFKKSKQKGRVLCAQTVAIYEFLLKENGKLYISTDVKSLFDDMKRDLLDSKMFKEVACISMKLDEKTFEEKKELSLFEMTYMG